MNYKSELTSQLQTRFSIREIKSQITNVWKSVTAGVLYLLAVTGFIVLTSKLTDNPIWKIAKDPAEVMRFPAYIGMLSNLGNIFWVMTATICLFGAIIIKQHLSSQITCRLFFASGMFSLFLGIDDLFLLHDHVFPKLLHIPERVFYLSYLIAIIVYLIYFLPRILKYEYLLLGTSVLLFGSSRIILAITLVFDQFKVTADVLKHFGIVFWLIFFYRTVSHEVNMLIHKSNVKTLQ